jgi:hypothetical protein
MLIAKGNKDEETGFITNPIWEHIPSGYNADYIPFMTVSGENIAEIKLTSAHATDEEMGDLGLVQLAGAENSNVAVSVSDNKIAIGLKWGTF